MAMPTMIPGSFNIAAMAAAAASAVPGAALGAVGLGASVAVPPGATRFVVLTDAVTMEEIADDDEYKDIIEVRGWCSRRRCV